MKREHNFYGDTIIYGNYFEMHEIQSCRNVLTIILISYFRKKVAMYFISSYHKTNCFKVKGWEERACGSSSLSSIDLWRYEHKNVFACLSQERIFVLLP